MTQRVLDTVDTVVATVHDKAVRPAIVAARAVVFGVIISVVAVAVVILLCIAFVRLATDYFFDDKVWISYLVLGGLFCLAGAFGYSRRGAPTSND